MQDQATHASKDDGKSDRGWPLLARIRTTWRSLNRSHSGIGLRLLARVLLFSSVITLLLTLLQLYFDYRRDVGTIDRQISEIEGSYRRSLGEGLWNLDARQLELQVDGILHLPGIRFVEVREATDRADPMVVTAGSHQANVDVHREFPIFHMNRGAEQMLGVLSIEGTLEDVYRRLFDTAIVILISQGTKTFVVSFFILYIVDRLITRHLVTAAKFLGGFDLRSSPLPLRLDRRPLRGADELDQLVGAFNGMCASLHTAYGELRESEERMTLASVAANLSFWVWDIPGDDWWASATDWRLALWDPAKPVKFDHGLQAEQVDDRDLIRRAIHCAIHGDGDFRVEFRVPLPDSTMRWIAARGRVEFDGKGQSIRMRGVSIDITERRRAEEEARDLSGRLISAQEDERTRLACALHDDITQRLALLAIEAGRNESRIGDAATQQVMRSMRNILTELGADVHALSYALHPAILEHLGLVEALRVESDRFSAAEAIPVKFRAEENLDELSRQVGLCMYRIAQEALRNVARHADASEVEVGLGLVDGGLQLSVRDNGVGFDSARKPARPSLGLASMRERASLVGGELRVDAKPGYGTAVEAWVPLSKEAHRESSASVAG